MYFKCVPHRHVMYWWNGFIFFVANILLIAMQWGKVLQFTHNSHTVTISRLNITSKKIMVCGWFRMAWKGLSNDDLLTSMINLKNKNAWSRMAIYHVFSSIFFWEKNKSFKNHAIFFSGDIVQGIHLLYFGYIYLFYFIMLFKISKKR